MSENLKDNRKLYTNWGTYDTAHHVCSPKDVYFYKGSNFRNIGTTWFMDDKHQFSIENKDLTIGNQVVTLPNRKKIFTVERLALNLGLYIDDEDFIFDCSKIDFINILHILTAMALKDHRYIDNRFAINKQTTYGERVFELYNIIIQGSGRVLAKNKHMRWFNEQDTKQLKAKLFYTSNCSYQSNGYSMEYTPTKAADTLFSTVFDYFKTIEFATNDINLEDLDFIVTIDVLQNIKLQDSIILLKHCIGYNNGLIIRPKLTDTQNSRIYSLFTSISSNTRKQLGYINYDIGAALQTITLQLVKDPNIYPLHQELMRDKHTFRDKVMKETAKDIKWVKKELSKIDNLNDLPKKYTQYPTLTQYYQEAVVLRKEVISNCDKNKLEVATSLAKHQWNKVWSKEKHEFIFTKSSEFKESSLFFFIWTQYERIIREAMVKTFSNPKYCHQVHDAVYSKEKIYNKIIEQKVLDETGFVVQISN